PPPPKPVGDSEDRRRELDCAGGGTDANAPGTLTSVPTFAGAPETLLQPGPKTQLVVPSTAGFPLWIGLRLEAPKTLAPGQSAVFYLVQLDDQKRPVGGIAVMIVFKV